MNRPTPLRRRRRRGPDDDQVRPVRPGPRGWAGPGRGQDVLIEPAPTWRGTTVQVCGLWPWIAGSGTPNVGVPFGRHLGSGATVCCDPISWFRHAGLISNPSMFMLGLPGTGKTAAVMRLAVGMAGHGAIPLVLGDTRPDFIRMVRALDGQVISIGRGRGALNVLDPGESPAAAARLAAAGFAREAAEVAENSHGIRVNMVRALITLLRGADPNVREMTIVARALTWLDQNHAGVPVIPDLLAVVRAAPPELREAALDRGDPARYTAVTEELEAALMALCPGGPFGDIFAKPTSEPMRRDRAVVFDVSGIPESETQLRGAALLACWTQGFASVAVAQTLADVGLEPRRHYVVILDELHQALKAGPGMVDRLDYLTRLNRTRAVAQLMITHTPKDLQSLDSDADRKKAMGFIERAGIVVCGPMTPADLQAQPGTDTGVRPLDAVVPMSRAEKLLLASWAEPPSWDTEHARRDGPAPAREDQLGRFLIKIGGRPGIPVKVGLTAAEKALHVSNTRWEDSP